MGFYGKNTKLWLTIYFHFSPDKMSILLLSPAFSVVCCMAAGEMMVWGAKAQYRAQLCARVRSRSADS